MRLSKFTYIVAVVVILEDFVEEKIELVEPIAVVVNLQDFLRLPDQVNLRLKVKNILKSHPSEGRVGPVVPIRMRSLLLGPQAGGQYKDLLLKKTTPCFVLWKLSMLRDIVR